MAKRTTAKATTKKTKKPAAKTTKKKAATTRKKQKAKPRASPFKSKLGHDPLAWITGEDASDLGVSFDDIEAKLESTQDQFDQVIPPLETVVHAESEPVIAEPSVENVQPDSEPVVVESKSESIDSDDGSWGLFGDDEPETIETKSASVNSDDGSWGLFGDDSEDKSLPVGEGVAWGLFVDESGTDSAVDHDAITIHLPAAFNVAEISKIYHDFDVEINKDHDVVVDASEVEVIDATGLQLLFACQKELQRRGCKMVIKDASEKVELLSSSSFINELLSLAG